MKLYFNIILVFTILQLTTEMENEEKTLVKVGALFFEAEEDIELSFDAAFSELNNSKFFEIKFLTIKRYIRRDDSCMLQRLACELIAEGVAAIFGPSSKATHNIVADIANSTGIPHLQFDFKEGESLPEKLNHRMTVNVAPAPTILARAYWDIIKTNYDWKAFTILYENDAGLTRLLNLMDINTLTHDFIKVIKISVYNDDYRVLWKEAAESFHEQRFILDCEPETLEGLLKVALEYNLLGAFKNWFLTNLDTHSSKLRYMYNESFQANITSVRIKTVDANPYERKKAKQTEIDVLYSNQALLPILMYDAVMLFANSARNIILELKQYQEPKKSCDIEQRSPWYLGLLITDEMKSISEDNIEPPFKTENMKFNEFGERIEFDLEIYKPTVNEPIAIWKPDNSIVPVSVRSYMTAVSSAQDYSIARKTYTVVTHFEEPYFMLKVDHENYRGIEKYEGYAVDLIHKISEIMDFEYNFMLVTGNGNYNPQTKEWDGIIRKLIDHHAQIGVCDLTITQTRREVVDFTVPFMQLGISILYYNTPPEPKNLFAFLEPFDIDVWIYMMVTQLVMTLLFVFMARISIREWENPRPSNPDPDVIENKWNTRNSFWLMIGSIMQQGCDILPRGPPMRILTGMWWFFSLMALSTYTASLAAFLTSNKMQSDIKSLNDLVDQTKVKFGAMRGGSTSLFFSNSNNTLYAKAWNQMKTLKPSPFTATNKEGVARVRREKGDYAFLMETTSMSYNIERNCDLKEIGSAIGEKLYGLAVPLGADYRSNLSVSILQLSEKGELYNLKNKWWKKHNVTCPKFHEINEDELSIVELGGVFLVLGGGIVIAVILGLCEFFWNVRRVAVKDKVTPTEAFKAELLFALKFWVQYKPIRIAESRKLSIESNQRSPTRSGTRSSRRSSKSSSRNSFLRSGTQSHSRQISRNTNL
ncbi:glutamate receptor ionotropic, kainate 2 [Teleopsis dalmanni]|uniref:glutamate receptor ionotropic, kainate 2 n=1 Tax=Teleopsis dalmanni TaxID=139649 RepID=UPI0018CD6646|nr:glutamate receptor ionotropic, kainate 2 [Teleopsis dalmanni]